MKIHNLPHVLRLIEMAIDEDLFLGDITSEHLLQNTKPVTAFIIAKQECVIAGQDVAARVFHRIDPDTVYEKLIADSACVAKGTSVSRIKGEAGSILSAERTGLNFLQRLCGIASHVHQITKEVEGFSCKILDTRKTTPGWRMLEKYAVRIGGGKNHRMCLGDGILIKDNHIKAVGDVAQAVRKARDLAGHLIKIQVEVSSMSDAEAAFEACADALLLDNLSPSGITPIVERFKGKITIEASGNITMENVKDYAATGIDYISMGSLTHSAKSADLSLKIE